MGTAGLAVGKLSLLFVGLVFHQYLLLFQGIYLSLSQHLLPSALASVLCVCCLSALTHLRPLNERLCAGHPHYSVD